MPARKRALRPTRQRRSVLGTERLPAVVLQAAFDEAIRAAGLPEATPEYLFAWAAIRRKWRIDRAWPEQRIALEIEGGIHMRGRHIRPEGFLRDMEKYNQLAVWGWLLLRVTYDMLADGRALALLEAAFCYRAAD